MSEADPLKNPENGKITLVSPAPAGSFASIKDADQLQLMVSSGEQIREAASADPVNESILNAKTKKGRSAAIAAGRLADTFSPGDRVYHKSRKKEAVVKEVGFDGRVRVKFDNGEKHWVRAENLVNL